MADEYTIFPVGFVRKENEKTWIEIDPLYSDALLGLEGFSHINVFYWFHNNDTPEKRNVLQVHPRRNPNNPLTGVFATHSPRRPNLIAFSLCKILSIRGTRIHIDDIDALDGSPVIDIKSYIPSSRSFSDLRVPDWV
jgi:tRNA-Thr(GGU) m(6)t(6)A37 methyltransferase TsaA